MALRQLLLTLCVVGSAADNATTTTAAGGGGATTTTMMATTTTLSNSTGGGGGNTTGGGTTAVSTLSGTLVFTTGSAAQCAALQNSSGQTALKESIKTASQVADTNNIAVTVGCGNRRRLSDGRRLTGPKATVNYILTIPAGSAANAATTAQNNLNAYTNAQWQRANYGPNGTPREHDCYYPNDENRPDA